MEFIQSVRDTNLWGSKWSIHNAYSNALYYSSQKHSTFQIYGSEGAGGLQKLYIGTQLSQKLHVRTSWKLFSE
jgi:hypothetical protein